MLGDIPPEVDGLLGVQGAQAVMGFEADTEAAAFAALIQFGDDAAAFAVGVAEFGGKRGFLPGLVTAVTGPRIGSQTGKEIGQLHQRLLIRFGRLDFMNLKITLEAQL